MTDGVCGLGYAASYSLSRHQLCHLTWTVLSSWYLWSQWWILSPPDSSLRHVLLWEKTAEELIIQGKKTLYIYFTLDISFLSKKNNGFIFRRWLPSWCLKYAVYFWRGGTVMPTEQYVCIPGREKTVQRTGSEPAFQSLKGNFSLICLSSNSCPSPLYQIL